jgi:hypothetical protein
MRAVKLLVATLIGFLVLESAVFRTPLYSKIVNPNSSTGQVELDLWNEQWRQKSGDQILTIGDSRMGFFARFGNALTPELGYTFATIAMAGSTPRCWYYMLRDTDPDAHKYRAIVIALNNFDDEDTYDDHADYESDLHYLIARLRWGDLKEFSESFHLPELKRKSAVGIALKGTVFKTDFQDLLLHPAKRMGDVVYVRRESAGLRYRYVGPTKNVEGIKIDWMEKRMEFPESVPEVQHAMFQGFLLGDRAPDHGRRSAYMKYWLGRIYDLYRGSPTRLIFIRLPRGPYPRPDLPAANPNSSVRMLARNPEVILDDEHTFEALEDPELFIDPMHLNGPGCERFSLMLARRLREILGPSKSIN